MSTRNIGVSRVGGIVPKTLEQKRVLKFCNSVRAKMALAPRRFLSKGLRDSPTSCAIANTVRYGTNMYICVCDCSGVFCELKHPTHSPYSEKHVVEVNVTCPKYIIKFIDKFDAGRMPEILLK